MRYRLTAISQNVNIIRTTYRCRYVPPNMRGQQETRDWWDKLYKVTSRIKELMTLEGSLMIGYTPLPAKNIGNFFRMVINCQPPPTESSMDHVIKQIKKFGNFVESACE